MRKIKWLVALLCAAIAAARVPATDKSNKKAPESTPLDQYLAEVASRTESNRAPASPGSVYSPSARMGDAFRDLRANQLDDIVTILVSDRASALTKGTTNSARKSSVKAGVQSFAGVLKAAGPLQN